MLCDLGVNHAKPSWTRNRKWCAIFFTSFKSLLKIRDRTLLVITIFWLGNFIIERQKPCNSKGCPYFSIMIDMLVYITAIFANRRHNFFILNANESCSHFRIITYWPIAIKEKAVVLALFTEFHLNIVDSQFGNLNLQKIINNNSEWF